MGKRRYYLRDVAQRWLAEAADADANTLIIVSPYIKGNLALDLVHKRQWTRCDVYTLFKAEDFISGASSLATLTKLLELRVNLFELPMLHAKMVIIPGRFASIGSQNVTQAGRKKKEATVAITNPQSIAKLERIVTGWQELCVRLTIEDIQDMEAAIQSLMDQYRVFKDAAQLLDQQLKRQQLHGEKLSDTDQADNEGAEDEEDSEDEGPHEGDNEQGDDDDAVDDEDEGLLEEDDLDFIKNGQSEFETESDLPPSPKEVERLAAFKKRVQDIPKTDYAVVGEVKLLDIHGKPKFGLVPQSGGSFIQWNVSDQAYSLERLRRYMFIIEDSCKYGWVRVAKTRMAFVGQGLYHEAVHFGDLLSHVHFESEWNMKAFLRSNMSIGLCQAASNTKDESIVVKCWFDASSLYVVETEYRNASTYALQAKQWIQDHEREFEKKMLELILTPFAYTKRLYGEGAAFFDKVGERYEIRLGTLNSASLLIARKC